LVVTQDFKGAGLWIALPHEHNSPFLKLKKAGRDSAGELVAYGSQRRRRRQQQRRRLQQQKKKTQAWSRDQLG
jgi:hypothetical protein